MGVAVERLRIWSGPKRIMLILLAALLLFVSAIILSGYRSGEGDIRTGGPAIELASISGGNAMSLAAKTVLSEIGFIADPSSVNVLKLEGYELVQDNDRSRLESVTVKNTSEFPVVKGSVVLGFDAGQEFMREQRVSLRSVMPGQTQVVSFEGFYFGEHGERGTFPDEATRAAIWFEVEETDLARALALKNTGLAENISVVNYESKIVKDKWFVTLELGNDGALRAGPAIVLKYIAKNTEGKKVSSGKISVSRYEPRHIEYFELPLSAAVFELSRFGG
ncbi:hypothetical protein ACFL11_01325 [Patescibacteria group bacterium]